MANNMYLSVKGEKDELLALGKEIEKYGYVYNNKWQENEIYRNFHLVIKGDKKLYILCNHQGSMSPTAYLSLPEDKELILTLAAQREGKKIHVGEYLKIIKKGTKEVPSIDSIIKILDIKYEYRNSNKENWIYYELITGEPGTNHCPFSDTSDMANYLTRKCTTEEIIQLFKNQQKQTTMQQFTVTGSKTLKQAFMNELKDRGYIPVNDMTEPRILEGKDITQGTKGNKVYQSNDERKSIVYTLPGDWDTALQAWDEYYKQTSTSKKSKIEVDYEKGESILVFTITKGSDIIDIEDGEDGDDQGTVDINNLKAIVKAAQNLGTWSSYNIVAPYIKIGCKEDIDVSNLQEVINEWKNLNS